MSVTSTRFQVWMMNGDAWSSLQEVIKANSPAPDHYLRPGGAFLAEKISRRWRRQMTGPTSEATLPSHVAPIRLLANGAALIAGISLIGWIGNNEAVQRLF